MIAGAPHVVVVGSGAAGLTAAIAAAREGAAVTLLESTGTVGGTTALSGGVAWVPGNHLQPADQRSADVADATTYLGDLSLGDVDPDLTAQYLRTAPDVLAELESTGAVVWQPLAYPDYHAGRRGASDGGRSVEPAPRALPRDVEARVRPAAWGARATQDEIVRGTFTRELHRRRVDDGVVTMGRALVGGLLMAALDLGVDVRTGTSAAGLEVANGAVVGARTDDGTYLPGAVVLATGGFERDAGLVRAFLRIPEVACTGAPGATGAGLRMAMSVGADLGNMSEAWWCPAVELEPGEPDMPPAQLLLAERGRPGSIMVDRDGRRFCNEAGNYNDVGRALHAFDPGGFRFGRDPAWLVVDAEFRNRHPIGPVRRGQPDPDGWVTAKSPEALARAVGLPAEPFVATIERFNDAAAAGHDPDFHRGESRYDRFVGDAEAPHPSLRPLTSPLTAVPVRAGTLGTKGGPRTDADGRVRRPDGSAVTGLFAAGNVAASPFGMLYPGAGGTIGPALVLGHHAGVAAARGRCRQRATR
jgi:3-oxosteroid 1-dehydrogenase